MFRRDPPRLVLGEPYGNAVDCANPAYMWYNLSAARNYQVAVRNRDQLAQLMTPAQIAEAQKLAREWKPKPER